jgi:integrase
LTEEIRRTRVYGFRPSRTFTEAATKYLNESTKATLEQDAYEIAARLKKFIGDMPLDRINMETMKPYIAHRKAQGVKKRTINHGLQIVRHILNLAAGEWFDENGLTWLAVAPKIKFIQVDDKREPYPLSWDEQDRLFTELPDYLAKMALFTVNTGCRKAEVISLRWEWERPYPDLQTSVFVIPAHMVKNRKDRVVVLNRTASAIVEEMRGVHPEYVFTHEGKPLANMYGRAWRKAREKAGLTVERVHDLKHTYGRRLRAAGVSEEDRKDLLGHKSGRSMTTHYSMAEIATLISFSN